MFKKLLVGCMALALAATPALSAEVYRYNSGQWVISGHVENNEASCVVSTFWDNGAQININVFPKRDGTQYTTMTIYNPAWDPVNLPINESFTGDIIFKGSFGTVRLSGVWQIYGPQKVILRDLSSDFSNLFIAARKMVIFPNSREKMIVGLTGTRNGTYALAECINTVLY